MFRGKLDARLFIFAPVLLVMGVLAHHLGGGDFVSLTSLFQYSLFILIVLTLMLRFSFEGPGLALATLVAQSASHIILGGMSGNGTLMMATHLLGGFGSYYLVTALETSRISFEKLIARFFQFFAPIVFVSFDEPVAQSSTFTFNFGSSKYLRSLMRHAPPTFFGYQS